MGKDGTARANAELAVVIIRRRGNAVIGGIVLPGVAAEVVVEVILVSGAMPSVGTALGDHFNLRAGRIVEVGGLVGGVHLELFNAIGGGRQHACRTRGNVAILVRDSCRIAGKRSCVDGHAAVHVIGVVAAIQRKCALVDDCAGHAAVWTDAHLQSREGAGIMEKAGELCDRFLLNGTSDSRVQGLQIGPCGLNFDGLLGAADMQFEVCGGLSADLHGLIGNLVELESGFARGDDVAARSDVDKCILAGVARDRCPGVIR